MILSNYHEEIVREILTERARQAELHPADETGELDFGISFLALSEEKGEVAKAALEMRVAMMAGEEREVLETYDREFRAELVQLIAVGFKMLEAHRAGRLVIAAESEVRS